MSLVSLAIALLQFVSGIMVYARERELISRGQDEVIAEVTRSIFEKTTAGKAIMERVNGMSNEEVDAGLRSLRERTDVPRSVRQEVNGYPPQSWRNDGRSGGLLEGPHRSARSPYVRGS